jgi:hypothetical protein
MIGETFFICLLFQLLVLMINILGYTKIPAMSLFGIMFELIIMVPTIIAFTDYEMFAIGLAIMNLALPVYALSHNLKE